jgi:hypothetical protein
VPAEIEPPELAQLVAFAERPRAGDWSLRSALTRYAQPQPQRVSVVLDSVRRIEFALQPEAGRLAKEGAALWAAVDGDSGADGDDVLVGLLGAAAELDRLGDTLAAWALDRTGPSPEATVDATTTEVERRLDDLGIPREERERPPGARSRG